MLNLLVFITVMGWGVGAVFTKLANDRMHPMMVIGVITLVYMVLTPLAFFGMKFDKTINLMGVGAATLSAICVAIGSIAYFFALKRGEAGTITTLTAMSPVITLIISMIFLKEELSLRKGIGIALALVSFLFLSAK